MFAWRRSAVAVEVLVHVLRSRCGPRRTAGRCRDGAAHIAKSAFACDLIGHLVKPVAVREAQEDLEVCRIVALEARGPTPGSVMSSLLERARRGGRTASAAPPCGSARSGTAGSTGGGTGRAGRLACRRRTDRARRRPSRSAWPQHMKRVLGPTAARRFPEAVVAVARLEIARGSASNRAACPDRPAPVTSAEADEIGARQRARIVEREIGDQRHAVVLELAVADRALARRCARSTSGWSRNAQCEAMRGARCSQTYAGTSRAARSPSREHRRRRRASHSARPRQCAAVAVARPRRRDTRGRSGTAVSCASVEREVVGEDLDAEHDDVDVVEEVEVDVRHVERDRRPRRRRTSCRTCAMSSRRKTLIGDSPSLGRCAALPLPFAIEEALHVAAGRSTNSL